jgi:hypothetical protein
MTDFRNLQHYLVQLRASPTADEYYLDGYSLLRQCTTEAQTILQAPFSGSSGAVRGDAEQERLQLKAYVAPPLGSRAYPMQFCTVVQEYFRCNNN